MTSRSSFVVGAVLIVLGVALLGLMLLTSLFGINLLGFALRFWPVAVSAVGLAFVLPPLVTRKPGLGALFIPGLPILVTAGILLIASVLDAWSIWAWLWPMEVLGVALGFVAAAVWMRVIWLMIPATIIGLNGLVFQFCAVTGLWEWWSVLWTVEPFAVGLPLLLIGLRKGIRGLNTAGLILLGIAAAGFALMVSILGALWPVRLFMPVLLILVGLGAVAWGAVRRHPAIRAATE